MAIEYFQIKTMIIIAFFWYNFFSKDQYSPDYKTPSNVKVKIDPELFFYLGRIFSEKDYIFDKNQFSLNH